MSYILESLKKSDRDRQPTESAMVAAMTAPEFLNYESPPQFPLRRLLIAAAAVILTMVALVYFYPKSSPVAERQTQLPPSATAIAPQPPLNAPAEPVSDQQVTPETEKQAAVALYEQTLTAIDPTDVDALYQQTKYQQTEQSPPVGLEPPPVAAATIALPQPTPTPAESAVIIPSIYQLSLSLQASIPAIDYGAHIYATDNSSGFVILNGARARVGDSLANGVYVEKIEEEQVVLSYNGTLFALPAMKSWTPKS